MSGDRPPDRTFVDGRPCRRVRAVVRATLAFGVAALFPVYFVPEDANARAQACASPGSKTVRQTSQVRIYERRFMTYGCFFRTNRRTLLADNSFGLGYSEELEQLRLSGPYAGYNLAFGGRGGTGSVIVVANLRTGRNVRSIRGTPVTGMSTPVQETVTDLVLKSNGSVAWIWDTSKTVTFPQLVTTRTVQVRKSDRSSGRFSSSLLDSGLGLVDPRSLAIRNSTISWKKAGQLRTAQLR
jgi:hypothetical protein